jgi:zinc transporter ZupT
MRYLSLAMGLAAGVMIFVSFIEILPEAVEKFSPKLGSYLRSTSPRWGRSWRNW